MNNKTVSSQNGAQTVGNQGEGIHDLTRAFDMFSQKIGRLEEAYHILKKKFTNVNIELEETNHYLSNILGNMTQGLIFLKCDGTIKTFNRAAETILGLTQQQVEGKLFSELFDDTLLGFSVNKALQNNDLPGFTNITLTPETGARQIEVEATLMRAESEESQGLLILIHDVTELRKWKHIADRSDRMKELGEMAASVAHEIRNPLGGIKGFASLLKRDLEDRPESQKMARYIIEGAEDLNHLVTNILHYSRPLQLDLQPTDLSALIDEVVQLLQMDPAFHKGISVEQEPPKNPISLSVDRLSLKGAFLNLLINSNQAIDQTGTIKTSVERVDNDVHISITDDGHGIAPDQIEKIFSPFFTTKHGGNGFGLSEVHRVIQGHGGTIDVKSTVGKGTKFVLKIPATS